MKQVDELTGDEGGRWQVFTQGSSYRFDLDAGTVTRIPGPHSSPTINDCQRRILQIKLCRVGFSGYWTMHPDGAEDTTEYFWQATTEIRCIEKLTENERR